MRQGLLPLSYEHSHDLGDFVVADCNRAAFSLARMAARFQLKDRFFCVYGEEGSGKTHLSRGIAGEYGFEYQNAATINLDNSRDWVSGSGKLLILDDAQKITDDVWWFNTYNLVKELDKVLMIFSTKPPSMWTIELADWRSRLSTFARVELSHPDDDTLKRVLSKIWRDKGISVDLAVLDYLSKRIDRNFASVKHWARVIDLLSARGKRPITLNLLRGMFV